MKDPTSEAAAGTGQSRRLKGAVVKAPCAGSGPTPTKQPVTPQRLQGFAVAETGWGSRGDEAWGVEAWDGLAWDGSQAWDGGQAVVGVGVRGAGSLELTYEALLALDDDDGRGGGVVVAKARCGSDREAARAMKARRFRGARPEAPALAETGEGAEVEEEEEEEEDACLICLEPFEPGEKVASLRRCRCTRTLLYHRPCLRQWLKADASCPQCRAPAIE